MIAILLATISEAQPLLELLMAEKRLDQPFATYSFQAAGRRPGGLIIIAGIGPKDAAAATDYAITARGATRILNVGICGALTHAVDPGHMCHITEIVEGDVLLKDPTAPSLPLPTESLWRSLPSARLVSVSEPVFGGEGRAILAAHADMVDMEGYAIVQTCQQKGIPFQLLKVVSDRADDTGHEELHLNLTRVSTILAEEVIVGLEHHLAPPVQSLMARLFNFVKIEHTIFSIPLLLAGAWLGAGGKWPGLHLLMLIMLAGVGARALGMAMNRILDRHLDQLNPRTVSRELPSGKLSTKQAWGVAATGLFIYLAACAALGPLCLKLSTIPALVLITYSLLKRLSCLCHYGIGVCLALGPLGAFVAVRGSTDIDGATLMLTLFTFCWISGFDIIYALQDIKADREIGVHSLPAALGSTGAQWVAALTHLIAAAAAIQLWVLVGGGLASGLALTVTIAALGLAYWSKLPLHARFFPVSAIAGIAGAMIAML
ncbi:MAG: UbiA-like polyprenyltransferase [bacterium]|jgi:4-hydroxybenzoate polyprenyltransferase